LTNLYRTKLRAEGRSIAKAAGNRKRRGANQFGIFPIEPRKATVDYWIAPLHRYFGEHCPVSKITYESLLRYIGHRGAQEHASRNSIRHELGVVARGFKAAVSAGLLLASIVQRVPAIPEDMTTARKTFISYEYLLRLGKYFGDDYVDLLQFAFFSGWRSRELNTLSWQMWDREAWGFRLARENDKTRQGRYLSCAGKLDAVVRRRLKKRRLDTPLVFHVNGRPIGDIRKRLAKACTAAGIPPVTMHAFRRSMVKFYSDAGVDQAAIMQFTGHRTDSMFRRYRIVDTTSQVLAAKKVARWADELAAETPTRGTRTRR
jgi:integrase